MSLLRQRAYSGSSLEDLDEVLSEHDEEEEHRGLLQEDDYDAAKFKILNLAAPRGQILNFEFCKKNDDGDRPTDVALLIKGIQTTLGGITGAYNTAAP